MAHTLLLEGKWGLSLHLGLVDGDTRWALQHGREVAAGCDHPLCPSFCKARPVLGKDAGGPGPQPAQAPQWCDPPTTSSTPAAVALGVGAPTRLGGGWVGGKLIPGSVTALSPMAI